MNNTYFTRIRYFEDSNEEYVLANTIKVVAPWSNLDIIATLGVLLGCAGSVSLVSVWTYPEFKGNQVEKVLVVGMAPREQTRSIFEYQLTNEFNTNGVNAMASLDGMPKDEEISKEAFVNRDLHIHVPSGATPKDGPSAGITMAVALASIFTGRKVKSCMAMTGEITLRGQILPIGGLKEKLLAALRGGIEIVLIPKENERDLIEIPDNIKQNLDIRPVRWIDEIFEVALKSVPKMLSENDKSDGLIKSDEVSTESGKDVIRPH